MVLQIFKSQAMFLIYVTVKGFNHLHGTQTLCTSQLHDYPTILYSKIPRCPLEVPHFEFFYAFIDGMVEGMTEKLKRKDG